MVLFVAGAANRSPQFQRFLGDFVSPARRQHVGATDTWAADNGCFGDFSEDKFRAMLDAAATAPVAPVFVTVPDVVGNHAATCERWHEWTHEFRARGLKRAFVLQNGIEDLAPQEAIPWSLVDALFIGGNDEFKLGPWAREAMKVARRPRAWGGKRIWLHMGRVNSVRRMRLAQAFGCDSCDGSGMARFPIVLERMCRALAADEQPALF